MLIVQLKPKGREVEMFPSKAQVLLLRQQYPSGTRIRLIEMPNDPQPIPQGATGTVKFVDDAGQLLMDWDNGRSLSLIPGEDRFETIQSPFKK